MYSRVSVVGLAAGLVFATAPVSGAVVTPYINDFSSSASDFTSASTMAPWVLSGGYYTHASTATGTATAAVEVSTLGGAVASGNDFTITGRFVSSNNNGTGTYVGLVALGSSSAFTGTYYYMRQMSSVGTEGNALQLLKGTTSLGTMGGNSTELRDMFSANLEFTLSGIYVDTNDDSIKDALDLTATFRNLSNSTLLGTLTYRDASPLTGHWFGMKDTNTSGNGIAMNVSWDSITIPEPATLAVSGLISLALLRRRPR